MQHIYSEDLQSIRSYLLETYKPKALVLHGSRVTGNAGLNSDYDIALIGSNQRVFSHKYGNHHLDLFDVPGDTKMLEVNGIPMHPAQVLHDDASQIGTTLVNSAKSAYDKGPELLTLEEIDMRRNFAERLINRMEDRKQCRMTKYYYMAIFYPRVIRYWFELNQLWTLPIYAALKTIKEKDPFFLTLLENLYTEASAETAQKVYNYIFIDEVMSND